LRCKWCQNPESINPKQEIWWDMTKCIGCQDCLNACPKKVITWVQGKPHIDREKCDMCLSCVQACPSQALAVIGCDWTLDQITTEVLKDKEYFNTFKGGLTVSGGEPLCQAPFLTALFKRMKQEGIHTALDTCGFVDSKALDAVLPYTDCILYDLKLIDEKRHIQQTGQSNARILENLLQIGDYIRQKRKTGEHRMTLWIRTPLIPGTTSDESNLLGIGEFILTHLHDVVERWELCAFNNICTSKYSKMGKDWFYKNENLLKKIETDDIRHTLIASGISSDMLVVTGLVSGTGSD